MLTSRTESAAAAAAAPEEAAAAASRRIGAKGTRITRVTRAEGWAEGEGCELQSPRIGNGLRQKRKGQPTGSVVGAGVGTKAAESRGLLGIVRLAEAAAATAAEAAKAHVGQRLRATMMAREGRRVVVARKSVV